ncbi:FMN-dependent NADH-azoreductase [Parendozoicomonas haliclonae]|uniref:FMN dependent NADH:quinone oxidoreductase n=1 Tax=Parendozoicomonas haliclonae TaxID=1960125 RepID=A0A1X7ARP1_9GAMM|nr:FMN-dependent NADH-azoreductase [Parendozoicomonas haliclonae]SMA50768.1 FMN-dependent NADH-azoreductase [Parendozoicomonas haliclonae]
MSTLILKSSILGEYSQSNKVIEQVIAELPEAKVRDLAVDTVPVLDASVANALRGGDSLTDEQQAVLDFSDELIAELKTADTVVITAPMYNFMIPTQLKNYLDIIARAGVTFRYTETGPVGLIENKKVIVVTTRGGIHVGSDRDHVTGYLKTMLGFIGLTDVDFIYSEAHAMGGELAAENHANAVEALKQALV